MSKILPPPCLGHDTMTPGGRVRKAVFPVAGFGTGVLPATKASPKELLPVVDKPLIQYAVEEAARAGIRQMIFVTSRHKRAIEDHFDKAGELEAALAARKRGELLAELRRLVPQDVSYVFVRQHDPVGLGHAMLCAREVVGEEPFAVVLPDELIDASVPVMTALVRTFARFGQPVVATLPPSAAADNVVGYVETTPLGGGLGRAKAFSSERGRYGQALAGRFVLTPDIFDFLATTPTQASGEVELCDAFQAMLAMQSVVAQEIEGVRFDCGDKLAYLAATLHFGMRHPQLGGPFGALVRAAAAAEPVASRRTPLGAAAD